MNDRRQFLKNVSLAAAAIATLPLASACSALPAPGDPKAFTGKETFDRLTRLARERSWAALPIGERIAAVALELRGVPYVGATLELYEDREVCSVNLLGLDCVTLFESALGFARMLKAGGDTPQGLLDQVTFTRYRGGRLGDYTSRLHYTTDWFHDNVEKKVVRMVTGELPGAIPFTKTVNFMSTHPDAYRQLKANPAMVPVIAKIEARINAREMFYVPKDKVAAIERLLRTGDIIGITTTINGIDCSHTGLCYRDDGGVLRLLHASLTKKEVTLDERLSDYLAGVSKHTGIMVARPIE